MFKWIESGMTDYFPDLPKYLQSSMELTPPVEEKTGVLAALEKI